MYIFDDLFGVRAVSDYHVGHEYNSMAFKSLWAKHPDWGGMILELMKNNQEVHL